MPMMMRHANMGVLLAAGHGNRKARRVGKGALFAPCPPSSGAQWWARHQTRIRASEGFAHPTPFHPISPSFGNAPGAAASAAQALALSSSIWRTSGSMPSNFNSSRMKAMKATSSTAP
jgi:hypothetical protein